MFYCYDKEDYNCFSSFCYCIKNFNLLYMININMNEYITYKDDIMYFNQ